MSLPLYAIPDTWNEDPAATAPLTPGQATGPWKLDNIEPVPAPIVARLTGPGHDFRLATWGRLVKILEYDFGPPTGRRTVFLCEKGALVWLPELAAPFHVQGVLLTEWRALLTAAGR